MNLENYDAQTKTVWNRAHFEPDHNARRSRICLAIFTRLFGWGSLAVLVAFLFNNYLTYWRGWPGPAGVTGETADISSMIQAGFYGIAVLFVASYLVLDRFRLLREERERIVRINSFLIRTAFWSVLLIGLVDFSLAFLRGENLLAAMAGDELFKQLMRAEFRGGYVHMSLVGVAIIIASITRSIGVTWLSLLIVVAELLLVISRFVFSYEQDYMADLVRFWYAPLFLIGCAYALREEGHVRIDVLYTALDFRSRSVVNACGAVLLGMPFCWLILIVGTSGKAAIINSALLTFEIEGIGNGLYVFYLMTVFIAVFAITMLVELVGTFFDAVADCRGEPGGRNCDAVAGTVHPATREGP